MASNSEECPTGILIDYIGNITVSITSDYNNDKELEDNFNEKDGATSKPFHDAEDLSLDCKTQNISGNHCLGSELNRKNDEVCFSKTEWRSPSPTTMNMITFEASRIVEQLHTTLETSLWEEEFPLSSNSEDECFEDCFNESKKPFQNATLAKFCKVNEKSSCFFNEENKVQKGNLMLENPRVIDNNSAKKDSSDFYNINTCRENSDVKSSKENYGATEKGKKNPLEHAIETGEEFVSLKSFCSAVCTTTELSLVMPEKSKTLTVESCSSTENNCTLVKGFVLSEDESTLAKESCTLSEERSTIAEEGSTTIEGGSTLAEESPTMTKESSVLAKEGPTLAKEGSTVTEEGPVLAKKSSTLAKEGSTLTEEGSTLTEEGSTLTEEGSILTEEGSTVTEEGSTVTEKGSTLTEKGSTLTEEGSTLTEEGSTLTEEGSTLTEEGSTLTEEGSTLTEQGSTLFAKDSMPSEVGSVFTEDGSPPPEVSFSEAEESLVTDSCIIIEENSVITKEISKNKIIGIGANNNFSNSDVNNFKKVLTEEVSYTNTNMEPIHKLNKKNSETKITPSSIKSKITRILKTPSFKTPIKYKKLEEKENVLQECKGKNVLSERKISKIGQVSSIKGILSASNSKKAMVLISKSSVKASLNKSVSGKFPFGRENKSTVSVPEDQAKEKLEKFDTPLKKTNLLKFQPVLSKKTPVCKSYSVVETPKPAKEIRRSSSFQTRQIPNSDQVRRERSFIADSRTKNFNTRMSLIQTQKIGIELKTPSKIGSYLPKSSNTFATPFSSKIKSCVKESQIACPSFGSASRQAKPLDQNCPQVVGFKRPASTTSKNRFASRLEQPSPLPKMSNDNLSRRLFTDYNTPLKRRI